MFCPWPSYKRSRRTATVTQSAPERSSDCCIWANVSYLPVPTIKRLRSVCEPIISGSSAALSAPPTARFSSGALLIKSAAPYERDNLQAIAVLQLVLLVQRTRHYLQVHFHGHAAGRHLQPGEQLRHRQRRWKLLG